MKTIILLVAALCLPLQAMVPILYNNSGHRPTDIPNCIWYASAAEAMTTGTPNGKLTTLHDMSTNAAHLIAASGAEPYLGYGTNYGTVVPSLWFYNTNTMQTAGNLCDEMINTNFTLIWALNQVAEENRVILQLGALYYFSQLVPDNNNPYLIRGASWTDVPMLINEPTNRAVILSLRHTGTRMELAINGSTMTIFTNTTASLATANRLLSLGGFEGGSFGFNGQFFAGAAYNRSLTDAEYFQVIRDISHLTNIKPAPVQLDVYGDSISLGTVATSWAVFACNYLGGNARSDRFAIGGATVTNLMVAATNGFYPSKAIGGSLRVGTFMGGVNDFSNSGATSNEVYGWAGTIVTNALQVYDYVILCTIAPSEGILSDSTKTENWTNYNAMIRANATNMGAILLDAGAFPHAINPSDTNYFLDGTHPSNTLESEWGLEAARIIRTLRSAKFYSLLKIPGVTLPGQFLPDELWTPGRGELRQVAFAPSIR